MSDRAGLLTPRGVTVLLVYGAEIKTARAPQGDDPGQPGIRVTAGYHAGAVLLEAVGFEPAWSGEALATLDEAVRACQDAGLEVRMPPHRMSNHPARVVNRRLPSC